MRRRHAIFIVPFRALAEEHFALFRRRYGALLTIAISTSDHQEFDSDIRAGNINLSVMTYEKLTGFLVQQPNLLSRCSTLVVDEVQSMSDPTRGANLEIMLTQAMRVAEPPQIVALSASLDELHEIDSWLKAETIISSERPVPLTECVCVPSGRAVFADTTTDQLVSPRIDREGLILALASKVVGEDKQVIIFRSSISKVHETANTLKDRLAAAGLAHHIDEALNELDDSESVGELRLCLAAGVGFHNADLTYPERQLVEDAFRAGDIKALVATTTLAMGVNLPTDVVIVADSKRWVPAPGGWEPRDISVAEYRNAAGRAGRLGQRSEGLAVLVADGPIEQRQLVNSYLLGRVEPIESQIPRRAFADVLFDLIACGIAVTEDVIVEFISSTFAYMTFYEREGGGIEEVRAGVSEAIAECLLSEFVVRADDHLSATRSGRVFAAAGLSLASAMRLVALLGVAVEKGLSREALIFEIANCSEVGDRPWLRRRKGVEFSPSPEQVPGLAPGMAGSRLEAALNSRSIEESKVLVRTKCLLDWMDGDGMSAIGARFRGMGAASARVRDLGKSAAWLLDTLAEVARGGTAAPSVVEQLNTVALEARYGLPASLAPLARLSVRGVTRNTLLGLYRDPRGLDLFVPEQVLDLADEIFDGLLTPTQLTRIRQAIVDDIQQALRLRQAGQHRRAEESDLPTKLVDDLYTTTGKGLEQAVTDALTHVGISAGRVLRQPSGEEDIRVAHPDGTVVISVTAAQDDARPVRWNKAKEILGTGAGLSPVNYVCVARPSFDSLAERSAASIARETGGRSILLMPIAALAEAIVRISEDDMSVADLSDLLARGRGLVGPHDFEMRE
jgi:replicative superfamily II helicase